MPVQGRVVRTDPASNQWVAVIDSGVNVIVDVNANVPGIGQVGTIDISTDRLVIWTAGLQEPDLTGGRTLQDQRTPLEFYMEGNIVFRQGERTIYADRMYYDVPNNVGTVLNADVLTPVPQLRGAAAAARRRVAADRQGPLLRPKRLPHLQPHGRAGLPAPGRRHVLRGHPAAVGRPGHRPAAGGSDTGQPIVDHQRLATSSNNFIFLGPVPVFYWPVLATDLNEPTYYIRRARLKQDNVYGTQVLTNWNGYQLLGIRNKPKGTDFDISLDYLNKRGFGYGGAFTYDREDMFDIPGHVAGLADYWGIQDQGIDDLGQGRMRRPARSILPLSPLLATPRTAALRSAAQRRTGLDQRPELPGGILQERVGDS